MPCSIACKNFSTYWMFSEQTLFIRIKYDFLSVNIFRSGFNFLGTRKRFLGVGVYFLFLEPIWRIDKEVGLSFFVWKSLEIVFSKKIWVTFPFFGEWGYQICGSIFHLNGGVINIVSFSLTEVILNQLNNFKQLKNYIFKFWSRSR